MNKQELVKRVLDLAVQQVGTSEYPAGSNKVKYNDWFYGKAGAAGPWCGTSLSWIFHFAGLPLGNIGYLRGYAGCGTALAYLQDKNNTNDWGRLIEPNEAEPGDIFIVDWNSDGQPDHTGILRTAIVDGKFQTYEGNTSDKGNQSNGGTFMLKDRNLSVGKWYFIRPKVYDDHAH